MAVDIWTAPKTDWDDNYTIGYDDFNRIEQNTKSLRNGIFRGVQGFGFYTDLNGTYDGVITVQPGSCFSDDFYPIYRSSTIQKNLSTWAQGSGVDKGGVASGVTMAAHTWYYMYIIMDPVTGSVDLMFDSDVAGGNISSGTYTKKRYIGAFKTHVLGTNGNYNLCEMYSYDGNYVFINHNYMFTSTSALEYFNSAGINDTFQYIQLTDQVNSEGLALPYRPVRASLLLSTGSFTTSMYIGLFSAQWNVFTIPSTLVVGGNIQGEYYKNTVYTITGDRVELMIDVNGRLYLGMKNPTNGGSTIFYVNGYYDDRMI